MTTTLTDQPTDIPSFEILLNGEVLSQETHILSIVVKYEINRIPWARIQFMDGNVAQNDFPLSSSDLLLPGTPIEIKAGYHSENKTIFKGRVLTHRVRSKRTNQTSLSIEARADSYKMTLAKKFRVFEEMTDADLLDEVLSEYEGDFEVGSTSVTHENIVQHSVSDWDFLLSRAEASKLLVQPTLEGLKVKEPTLLGEPAYVLEYGNTVLEFDVEMDCRTQNLSNKSQTWNSSSQELTEVEGAEPEAIAQGDVSRSDLSDDITETFLNQGYGDEQELQDWADAKLMRSELSRVRGNVTGPGFSSVAVGDIVEIKGINGRFNGKAFVGGLRHEVAGGTWLTDVELGVNPTFFLESDRAENNANPLVPAIHNLYTGTVLALEDENGEDRVHVHLPGLHEEGKGIWARRATPDAGAGRGLVFRPEIEDEVVVGFVGSDPRAAVILGMLHSGAKAAPIEASDDNHIKGYVSRSEMKIIFDDEKSIMTLETPGGHVMTLDDDGKNVKIEDSNGSSILMDADGITIDSAANITLKAAQDINIEGMNIGHKADVDFTAEGTTANLEGAGQTVVKGGVVLIN